LNIFVNIRPGVDTSGSNYWSFSLLFLSLYLKALLFASAKFVAKSGSSMPIPAVAITPLL
jgi:hypothetical protein